ncbi:DNA-binding transcriptional regulator YhcF (GntR family) [Thermosporothrix hazakensis]|uniref:DNA-binding transcriptional regulator YhcF (GntR family) n=2 Tax=Thermosporothrix TaxID=768650 RepID=A0A326UCR1_THEHA|nr:DNA-binding transcriptional regulator YhcF (GntR family) [Thermosporothrix hazakensis]
MDSLPLLVIHHDSSVAPYEQLKEQLRRVIASGSMRAGEKLPPVRQFARDLGLAPNTVVRAYRELKEEGWIELSVGKRARVVSVPPVLPLEERQQRLSEAVRELLISTQQLGISLEELYAEIEHQVQSYNPSARK